MKLNAICVRECAYCKEQFSFRFSPKRNTAFCSEHCKSRAIEKSYLENKVRKIRIGQRTYLTKRERKREKWIEKQRKKLEKIGIKSKGRSLEFVESKSFYKSKEWRQLRVKVLMSRPHRCNLCNRTKRDDNIKLHVDHIKAKSIFPELALDIDNLQILCEDCNLGKSNFVYD